MKIAKFGHTMTTMSRLKILCSPQKVMYIMNPQALLTIHLQAHFCLSDWVVCAILTFFGVFFKVLGHLAPGSMIKYLYLYSKKFSAAVDQDVLKRLVNEVKAVCPDMPSALINECSVDVRCKGNS